MSAGTLYQDRPINIEGSGYGANATAAVQPRKDYQTDVVELDPLTGTYIAGEPAFTNVDLIPAFRNKHAPINWLGGSYSGADIKVVAHLYTEMSNDVRINELWARKNLANEIATACGQLMSLTPLTAEELNIVNYQDLRDYFLTSAGLGSTSSGTGAPDNDSVSNRMIPNDDYLATKDLARSAIIGLLRYGLTASGVTKIKFNAARMQKEYAAVAASIDVQIANLSKLEDYASRTVTLATLQTISVQSHREKMGVRALGQSYVKGYTRGPRTIGGSMIFTLFNEHALSKLIKGIGDSRIGGEMGADVDAKTLIPDQLPPLDLTIVFANEYGALSRMGIYGVEFMNDGLTMSIEDIMTEQVINFVARDVDIMTSVGRRRLSQIERGVWSEGKERTASELLVGGRNQYNEYLRQLGVRRSGRRF